MFGPVPAVENGFVIHRRHQGQRPGPVGDHDEGHLPALEELLDQDPPSGVAELLVDHDRLRPRSRPPPGLADHDALAGRQAVGLEDDREAEFAGGQDGPGPFGVSATRNRPVGMRCRSMNCLAKILLAFEFDRFLGRAENPQAALFEFIHDPQGQGRFRPDDRQVDRFPGREIGQGRECPFPRWGRFRRPSGCRRCPGAQKTFDICGLLAIFQAMACSRPPDPTMRVFIVVILPGGHSIFSGRGPRRRPPQSGGRRHRRREHPGRQRHRFRGRQTVFHLGEVPAEGLDRVLDRFVAEDAIGDVSGQDVKVLPGHSEAGHFLDAHPDAAETRNVSSSGSAW